MKAWRGDGSPRRTDTHDLDCLDCESWFPNFTELAAHVKARHSSGESEDQEMAKRKAAKPAKQTRTVNSIPRADRSNQSQTAFNPFIKASDIGREGARATFTMTGDVRTGRSQFGDQIISGVKMGNRLFDWGVKVDSLNHQYLEQTLGTNTKKWRGKKIRVVVLENMGKNYIAIERPKT